MSTSGTHQKVKHETTRTKLTKTHVDKLTAPFDGQAFVRDTELKGFGVRVTASGAKSFIVEKRIDGRVKRITLGRYPALTVEQARKLAQGMLGHIATGGNPVAEKKQTRAQGVTLDDAFQAFCRARKSLKPHTLYDYGRFLEVAFPDWRDRRVVDISKDMVARRHASLGTERGPAYANGALRFLRSLLNFAQAQYEDTEGNSILRENPVVRLTRTRAWYRVGRRRTLIKAHQLPAWYQAVMALKAPSPGHTPSLDPLLNPAATVADYLLLMLFTGLRRQEAATLTWKNVDLKARTLTIPDPKNHEPLTLPLSDFVFRLLATREPHAVNEYVFPGIGPHGYLIEPRAHIRRVIKASEVEFTIHDLRRTFITVAESLDIPAYAIKRLVNHKMSGDVTAGYIVMDVERLRAPMQRITDHLWQAVSTEAAVTPIKSHPAKVSP